MNVCFFQPQRAMQGTSGFVSCLPAMLCRCSRHLHGANQRSALIYEVGVEILNERHKYGISGAVAVLGYPIKLVLGPG